MRLLNLPSCVFEYYIIGAIIFTIIWGVVFSFLGMFTQFLDLQMLLLIFGVNWIGLNIVNRIRGV